MTGILKKSACCEKDTGCCCSGIKEKELVIDFLYLDLDTCERCKSSDSNLDEALDAVSSVLTEAGYTIRINKTKIDSIEMAIHHEFLSSPTIRINGSDIMLEVKESNCTDCGDICGDSVDCRVWEYEGSVYDEPPKQMIVEAVLKAVFGNIPETKSKKYELPENLKNFFDGLENK